MLQSRTFLQSTVPWIKALYECVLDGETLDPASVEFRNQASDVARSLPNVFQPISDDTLTQIYMFDAYRQLHQPLIRRIDANKHPVQLMTSSLNSSKLSIDQDALFVDKSHFEHGYTEKLWLYHKLDWPLLEQFSSGFPKQIVTCENHWAQNTEVSTQPKLRTINPIAARHLRVSFTRSPQMQSATQVARQYATYRLGVFRESRKDWLRSVRLFSLQNGLNYPPLDSGR